MIRCWDAHALLSCSDHPALFPPAVISGDEPREKIDLVAYFGKRPPGVLHCTTKFCDYGKATGADEYAQQDVSAPQGHQLRWGGDEIRGIGTSLRQRPESSSRMTSAPARPSGWLSCIDLRHSFWGACPVMPPACTFVPRPAHQCCFFLKVHRECLLATGSCSCLSKPAFNLKG